MRRQRSIRELRQNYLKQRKALRKSKNRPSEEGVDDPLEIRRIARQSIRPRKWRRGEEAVPTTKLGPVKISWVPTEKYKYTGRKLVICHAIDSLGLGGAQTMMMELINALNTYQGEATENLAVCLYNRHPQKHSRKMYESYGVKPKQCPKSEFTNYCAKHKVDIVVQHRISTSRCIKKYLPPNVKYVLVNHTINRLPMMREFRHCDAYVSVCNYLHNKTKWPKNIHRTRRMVILNGVENKYLDDIESADLVGKFKTGRCHRLTVGKFNLTSLKFLGKEMRENIPGFHHHLIGHLTKSKRQANAFKNITYHGQITDRRKKMSIIKSLDAYFYETTAHEGASIAILEALACGVPVLCKAFGGCPELVQTSVNGYVVSDRDGFKKYMKHLSDPETLEKMKRKTREDFEKRLHVRHAASKYVQLFEVLTK